MGLMEGTEHQPEIVGTGLDAVADWDLEFVSSGGSVHTMCRNARVHDYVCSPENEFTT